MAEYPEDVPAPDPTRSGALHDAVTHVIYMAYIGKSGSRMKAALTADKVLEAVMKYYEGFVEQDQ